MTKVNVVIPTLASVNTQYLKLCVESLRATTDWKIIVVSNGSKVKPDYRDINGISVHLHTRDQGQCNAVNIGAYVADADTKYLLISNDDMYYAPGWNRRLKFRHLVFSPNLIEPTNNAGSAKPFLKRDWGYTFDEFKKNRADAGVRNAIHSIQLHHNALDEPNHTEEPGFNMPLFIDYGVWRTIGGYDPAYDPWGSNSDTDLQTKVNLAGITPMRLRNVLVYHFSNKSGTFDGTHQEEWQKNWDYFDRKWGFNRDQLGSDVWYNKNMLPTRSENIKYQPDWAWRYAD